MAKSTSALPGAKLATPSKKTPGNITGRELVKNGIYLPGARVERIFRRCIGSNKISGKAMSFLTILADYTVGELIEGSSDIARAKKTRRICPQHISDALAGDAELAAPFGEYLILGSGHKHYYNSALAPKKKRGQLKTELKSNVEIAPVSNPVKASGHKSESKSKSEHKSEHKSKSKSKSKSDNQ